MIPQQPPRIQIGSTIVTSGHTAKVTRIAKSGVTAVLEDGRKVMVTLGQAEKTVTPPQKRR